MPMKHFITFILVLIIVFCCSCTSKKYLGVFFSVGFEDDTVRLVLDNETLLDTVLTTNYSTGKAYLTAIKRPSKSQTLKLYVNDQLKSIDGPFDSLRIHIYYLERKIDYKYSSKDLVWY